MQKLKNCLNVIKPAVRQMAAYHLHERKHTIKMNQNESPFDLPDALKKQVLTTCQSLAWNRYPTFGNSDLVRKLADYFGVSSAQVLVGNGSNELLQTIFNVILEAGKRVLLLKPTFLMYDQLVRVTGAQLIELEFLSDWSFPVDKIIESLNKYNIELCVLCSPNSPTGVSLAESDLEMILQSAPGIVLVDEAYNEFTKTNTFDYLEKYPNLVVTRTFSKAMGLAGLRIGALVGHQEIIKEINKAKLPYNLDLFSEITAKTLLENSSLVQQNIELILSERERLAGQLHQLSGFEVFPSSANFLMVRPHKKAGELFERLLGHGILVRDISDYHPRLKNMLRISIGTPAENETLITALGTIAQECDYNHPAG